MGGFGSGKRYGWTKADTDAALRLDVRTLARDGCLAHPLAMPGAVRACAVTWHRGGQPFASITVRHDGWPTDVLTLSYRTRAPGGAWRDVGERIALDRTACAYGGDRPWFRCPGCRGRHAVLYSLAGAFRCRRCLDLAYASTREKRHDRLARGARKLRARLGGAPDSLPVGLGYGLTVPPEKPKGMHRRTYERLRAELRERELAAALEWEHEAEAFLARLDRSIARRFRHE